MTTTGQGPSPSPGPDPQQININAPSEPKVHSSRFYSGLGILLMLAFMFLGGIAVHIWWKHHCKIPVDSATTQPASGSNDTESTKTDTHGSGDKKETGEKKSHSAHFHFRVNGSDTDPKQVFDVDIFVTRDGEPIPIKVLGPIEGWDGDMVPTEFNSLRTDDNIWGNIDVHNNDRPLKKMAFDANGNPDIEWGKPVQVAAEMHYCAFMYCRNLDGVEIKLPCHHFRVRNLPTPTTQPATVPSSELGERETQRRAREHRNDHPKKKEREKRREEHSTSAPTDTNPPPPVHREEIAVSPETLPAPTTQAVTQAPPVPATTNPVPQIQDLHFQNMCFLHYQGDNLVLEKNGCPKLVGFGSMVPIGISRIQDGRIYFPEYLHIEWSGWPVPFVFRTDPLLPGEENDKLIVRGENGAEIGAFPRGKIFRSFSGKYIMHPSPHGDMWMLTKNGQTVSMK